MRGRTIFGCGLTRSCRTTYSILMWVSAFAAQGIKRIKNSHFRMLPPCLAMMARRRMARKWVTSRCALKTCVIAEVDRSRDCSHARRLEMRPNISAAPAARLADKPRLDIGKPDVVAPLIGRHLDRM